MNFLQQLYYFFSPKRQNLFLEYRTQFEPRYGHGRPSHHLLAEMVKKNTPAYKAWMDKAIQHQEIFQKIPLQKPADIKDTRPNWINGYLPGLDMVMLYTILVDLQPKRYLEIGSGNSTRVAHWAKTNAQLDMEITAIDPTPRIEVASLVDHLHKVPLEQFSYQNIPPLQAGDVLFVDNSHRILPNSDATVFFLEWLPQLPKGVMVQIHDVYLPFDYPDFMCERFYSEQYGLAIALLSNPEKFDISMANYYVSQESDLANILNPFWQNIDPQQQIERHGGSFWFTIQ